MATSPQSDLPEAVDAVVAGRLGGVVLVGKANAELAEALAPLGEVWPPPVIAVDEEGGPVQRLDAVLGSQPSARLLAGSDDPELVFETGRTRAEAAAELGFTMILAPVLDVGASAGSAARAYGDDASTVVRFGLAYAEGLASGGVVPVAKHFPGHGSADADSHQRLPTTATIDELRARDLVPFTAAVEQVPAVMIGHLAVPGLTAGEPATLSSAAVDLLRNDLGFSGLVVTDDLAMGAIQPLTVPEAAELAVAAGNDLLIAGRVDAALAAADRLIEALETGRLDRSRIDEALTRTLEIKGVDPCDLWQLPESRRR